MKLALLVLIATLFSTCGRKDQKVQSLVTSTGENTALSNLKNLKDDSCSSEKCPMVVFKIVDENEKEVKAKSLSVGDEADWNFVIQSSSVDGRLMLFAKQIPVWSNIKKGLEISALSITGTADQEVSDGKIMLVVRDLMKCKTIEEKIQTCLKTDEINATYDKEKNVGYVVSKK